MPSCKFSLPAATCAAAILVLVCASATEARVRTGEVLAHQAATAHPYVATERGGSVEHHEIHVPGAKFVKVHFSRFDLAPGDSVAVSSPDGSQRHVYTGKGPKDRGNFWAFSIQGDRAVVSLQASSGGGFGYEIDKVGRGDVVPIEESLCGDQGRLDAACFGPAGKSATRPVGRLLFEDGGGLFVCTGFLVEAPNASTLMTNEHCINSQTITDTLEVTFNFQRSSCGGFSDDPNRVFNGDVFLKADEGLDYALVTLEGDPAAVAGVYTATATSAVSGERIAIPQQPGGDQKEIALFEDAAQSIPCEVIDTEQTYGDATPGSQFNYACDTEGGSSGSPVLSLDLREVIGLHHFGSVTFPECSNGATHMDEICANAGASLLSCS